MDEHSKFFEALHTTPFLLYKSTLNLSMAAFALGLIPMVLSVMATNTSGYRPRVLPVRPCWPIP